MIILSLTLSVKMVGSLTFYRHFSLLNITYFKPQAKTICGKCSLLHTNTHILGCVAGQNWFASETNYDYVLLLPIKKTFCSFLIKQ